MKMLYHSTTIAFILSLSLLFFMITVEGRTLEDKVAFRSRFKQRRSNSGKNNHHMFSCVRKMKYWNGISCEDFTPRSCEYMKYYWDESQKRCFFTEEVACTFKDKHWTGQECIDYTLETCEQNHMVWNYDTSKCSYKQEEMAYIDLNTLSDHKHQK